MTSDAEHSTDLGRPGRVTVVVSSRVRRGAEVFGTRLAGGLADRGWWADLVSLTDDRPPDPIAATPAASVSAASASRYDVRAARGLRRLVGASAPDVVVAYGGPTLRYVATAIRRRRSVPRLVYVSIGEPSYWIRTKRQRQLYGPILRRMDRCLAVSTETARQLVDDLGVPPERVGVAPTGVPEEFFEPVEPDWDGRAAGVRFIFVGSLSAEKDPMTALNAYAAVVRRRPAQLRIVGDGPLRPVLEQAVSDLSLEGVTFTGPVADVRPHLAWADALLLTSKTEGLPGVVLEAAACGVPVVAYDVGGIGEAVVDGATGYLVSAGDASTLVERMLEISADTTSTGEMGDAARRLAQQRFTLDASVSRYHEELTALINRPARVAHLTTVDSSLRYLLMPQLREVRDRHGEAIGISAPGPDVAALREERIDHVALEASTRSFRPVQDARATAQLAAALRRVRPDVLHTHNPKPGLYGRVLGRLLDVPVVVNTVHGLYATEEDRVAKRAFVYALEAVAARFSHAELSQSAEDVELLTRYRIAPPERLWHLGNGIDLSRFDPAQFTSGQRHGFRSALGIERGEIAVGTVGRLVAEKGYPELFEAYRRLGPRYRLVVIGPSDPSKSDNLDQTVIDEAAQDGVIFLGLRNDVDQLYAAMDLFVLASHREGFPRAAMEAAAMELPVVATDIRGCREIVENGENGILVPTRDPVAIADAILEITADEDRMGSMGRAGRARALTYFDERAVVDRVMRTYHWVARRRRHHGLDRWLSAGPDVEIRPATPADAALIARLQSRGAFAVAGRRRRTQHLLQRMRDPFVETIVAEDAAGVRAVSTVLRSDTGVTVALETRNPAASEPAAARELLAHTTELAATPGASVRAHVAPGDVTLRRVYESLGFEVEHDNGSEVRLVRRPQGATG